jgi:CRISPR/Cas system-associated exonuclease Cas4 (RecB family)
LLYDIKRHFGLPTHQRKDAIFGYHFFRLLQRAETVHLIYDNESTNTLAEKSRFIEQLTFEIKKQHLQNSIAFTEKPFQIPFSFPFNDAITISKTPELIEKLAQFKYSPSSLSAYIQCPLQFYLKYIEKIVPIQIYDENNESAIIGTLIHKILEEIFTQLKGKSAQHAIILSEFVNNIDDVLQRAFKEQPEMEQVDIYQGKPFLAYQIVRKSILDYIEVIKKEWKDSAYQIIGVEINLLAEIDVGGQKVCFKGKTDRVEMRDNKVTILDYKTGKVEEKKLRCKANDFEDIFSDPDYSQLFQLLCYAYLYQHSNHPSLVPTTEIQCGIVAFQELYKQNDSYIFFGEIEKEKIFTHSFLLLFEEHLKQIFSSIINENIPFTQTSEYDNCKYCDYKNICNK